MSVSSVRTANNRGYFDRPLGAFLVLAGNLFAVGSAVYANKSGMPLWSLFFTAWMVASVYRWTESRMWEPVWIGALIGLACMVVGLAALYTREPNAAWGLLPVLLGGEFLLGGNSLTSKMFHCIDRHLP